MGFVQVRGTGKPEPMPLTGVLTKEPMQSILPKTESSLQVKRRPRKMFWGSRKINDQPWTRGDLEKETEARRTTPQTA